MLSARSGQLPSTLIVFDDQSGTQQKWLYNVRHGVCRQSERRRNDAKAARPVTDQFQVAKVARTQTQIVDLFEFASLKEMAQGNPTLSRSPTKPETSLK